MGTRAQRKILRVGDTVRVAIPTHKVDTGDTMTPRMAKKFNGIKAIITKKKAFGKTHSYYELEDIVTEHNIPYAFMPEWLEEVHDDDTRI